MPQEPIDYTTRYQIRSGRVNFANYVKRRQLIQDGVLIGLNVLPPDNDASIVPIIQEGAASTTPAELAAYLAEIVTPVNPPAPPPPTVPGAPTAVSAVAGNAQVTVSFTAPTNDGGATITGYTVTSNLGGFTATGSASPLTVTGLTNGTAYTFTVVATNSVGDSVASSASSAVTPEIPVPSGTYYSAPTTNSNVSTVSLSPFIGGGNSYSFSSTSPNPDYLTVNADDSWAFGTGDFTIEWFQNQTDSNSAPRIFSIGSYSTSNISIACSIEGPGTFYAWTNQIANSFGNLAIPYKNEWVHFAIVRQSGQLKVYRNGVLINGALSNTRNITNNSTPLYIGREQDLSEVSQFLGNLTNIRIVKSLAVYTGDFTVPTSALTETASANPYGGSNTQAIPAGFTKLLFVP